MASPSDKKKRTRPTLQMIADELGVTSMTVSQSLRGVGRISDETRRLIRDKAEEMGYQSSKDRLFPRFMKATSLSGHSLRLLCPTVGDLNRKGRAPYYNDMLAGLQKEMEDKHGGRVIAEQFESLDGILARLKGERFHGIVLIEPYPQKWVEAMQEFAPALYTISHDFQSNVDAVFYNESRAAALAVDRIRAFGHRQIAWLGIEDRNAPFLLPETSFDEKYAADQISHSCHGTRFSAWLYLASQCSGLAPWPVKLMDRDWKFDSLTDTVHRYLRELFQLRPKPSVIVCVGARVALEIIRQLEASGIRVPDDMGVVVYGIDPESKTEDGRRLSGLHMPMDKIGTLIPEVVQRRLAYLEGMPISIQLDAAWLVGETLKPMNRDFL